MDFDEIIELIEDMATLRKICKAAENKVWKLEFEHGCDEQTIKELKSKNEYTEKIIEELKEENKKLNELLVTNSNSADSSEKQMGGKINECL